MSDWGSFDDQHLDVLVFGPDYGESVVIHAPGDTWIVVDSLKKSRRGSEWTPALQLLKENVARWSCVVLTHPHDDHADGLADVLDSPGDGLVGCLGLHVEAPQTWATHLDAEEHLRRGAVEDALAAVRRKWDAGNRWDLEAGSERDVGPVRLKILYPPRDEIDAAAKRPPKKNNDLASPLLVQWEQMCVLLGADLEKKGWRKMRALKQHTFPLRYDAYKVAHHGSAGALDEPTVRPINRTVPWVLTPWRRGSGLPRYEDGEGMERLLSCVDEVHVTSLGVRLSQPLPRSAGTRVDVDRRWVDSNTSRVRVGAGARGAVATVVASTDAAEAWIRLTFDASGALVATTHGAAACVVSENAPPKPTAGRQGRKKQGRRER